MRKFLASIFKQKRIIFSLLLFFTVGALFSISTSSVTAVGEACRIRSTTPGEICSSGEYCARSYSWSNNPFVFNAGTCQVAEPCAGAIEGGFCFLAKTPAVIIGSATIGADLVATSLLNWILESILTDISYTKDAIVNAGWPIVRDFANILIVLGFIAIALATILRFQNYEAKALLVKLIIAALLVNFSLVICGVMIDIANITIKFFVVAISQESTTIAYDKLSEIWKGYISTTVGPFTFTMDILGLTLVAVMSAITRALFVFLFLFRVIALWMLAILSPLAFVCYVFPATKNVWDMWWKNFWQWVIIGIPGAFFLYLAGKIGTSLGSPTNIPMTDDAGALIQGLNDFMRALVPGLFLVMGFIISLQASATGSGIAIGMAKKTGGWTSKFAADKTQLTRLKNSVADRATSFGERMGVVNQGTTKARQGNRLEEAKKRLAYAKDDHEKLAEIASTPIGAMTSEKVREEKAAAAAMLAKDNKLNLVDANKRESVAAHAVAYGVGKDVITKNNPELVTGAKDEKTLLQKVMRRKSTSQQVAEQSLVLEERTRLEALGTSPEEAERLAASHKPSDIEIKVAQQKIHEATVRQRALGYSPTTDKEVRNKAIDDKLDGEKDGMKRVVELQHIGATDDQVKIFLDEEVERKRGEYRQTYIPSASDTVKARGHVIKEKIVKTLGKLSPSKAAELPKEAVSAQVLAAFSDSQIEQIRKRGGPNLINEIKKYVRDTSKSRAGQSQEFKNIRALLLTLPAGSPERIRLNEVMRKIKTFI